jgi:hypothetical protein
MMESLVSGVSASVLFRSLMESDSSMDSRKLGDILTLEYPDICPAASIAIRKWLNPKREYEFSDADVDGLILHYLKESGYCT